MAYEYGGSVMAPLAGEMVLIGRALEGLAGQARVAGLVELADTILALGLETVETARHGNKLFL